MVPKLIISIVTWNNEFDIDIILESLTSIKCNFDIGVIISDNNSDDNTCNIIKKAYSSRVLLIENKENLGFGKAHNAVIRKYTADYYLILNPDCYIEDIYAIQKLINFAQKHEDAWIIAPKILNTDGSIQYNARSFPNPMAALFRNTFLDKLFPDNPYTKEYLQKDSDHNKIKDVDWVSGAVMLIKQDLVKETGGFDERYFMYVEDMDLCRTVHEKGKRVFYYPKSVFYHKIGGSSDNAVIPMIREHHKSMYLYFQKYSSHIKELILGPFVKAILWLRMQSMIRK